MKHNKSLKRFMAFLLCAAMIITLEMSRKVQSLNPQN